MDARTKEAVRYLGYGRHAVDDRTLALIADSFRELADTADAKIIYRMFDLAHKEDCIMIGALRIASKSLRKNMSGCDFAMLLGATLGTGVDMLMQRYALTDMARVVALQACAAAWLEEYLDDWQQGMAVELAAQGLYQRPRFSPGYGDFTIGGQKDILRMLDAPKTIGLTLTEGGMLTPLKSVTAVVGLGGDKIPCHIKGCEQCQKTDCIYRRCGGTENKKENVC